MPFLELRPDCLTRPTLGDVAVLEATMLFPRDAERRAGLAAASIARLSLGSIHQVPPATSGDELRMFGSAMLNAPRISDYAEAARHAFLQGTVAAHLLIEAVDGAGEETFSKIKAKIASRFAAADRLTTKTIDNAVLPTFRSVMHLWAAYVRRTQEAGDHGFPCRPDELGQFLAAAEAYRERGEATRTAPKSPSTVLRPGDALMLPVVVARRLPARIGREAMH